jgi:hypothetical protein
MRQDLSGQLPEDFRAFNQEFIPIFLAAHPDKEKIAAGLACGGYLDGLQGHPQRRLGAQPECLRSLPHW